MKGLLKFITCGSVDDGKSTLIGHLLYSAKLLFADQKRALALESRLGSRDGKLDYSLLLDGLLAEREQGITIDVAYRYFSTKRRSFIVADAPGHEEYTRNMAVGASFADLAVLLVDATRGIAVQTKRHLRICALMGIRQIAFAVNKMDLVGYEETRYRSLEKELRHLAAPFDFQAVEILPVSATEGDNLIERSPNLFWYTGKTLLSYLETVELDAKESAGFLLPVQRVARPNARYRGFQGQIESGRIALGDEIRVLPSGEQARIQDLLVAGKKASSAAAGDAVAVQLDRPVDVSRGCVLEKGAGVKVGQLFTAALLWLDDAPLVAGKSYLLKLGTKLLPARVSKIKYKTDVQTGESIAAESICKNDLLQGEIALSEPIALLPFKENKALGGFLLIDRLTYQTAACGCVNYLLRRTENIKKQELSITRTIREEQKGQKALTLWFTGLSGAGKSTLANALEQKLVAKGKHTMLLDGDNLRLGLNRDLGFTEKDRIENIRRLAEVAKLLNDAGLIVLTACISPYRRDREEARRIVGAAYKEIYVKTPLEICEKRDVKGLYRKARQGKLPNFTGITSPYEAPQKPDLCIDGAQGNAEDTAAQLMNEICRWIGEEP